LNEEYLVEGEMSPVMEDETRFNEYAGPSFVDNVGAIDEENTDDERMMGMNSEPAAEFVQSNLQSQTQMPAQEGQAFTLTGKRPNTAGIRTKQPGANMNRDLMVPSLSVGKIQVHQKPDLVGYHRRIISVKNIVRTSGQGLSEE